MSEPIEISVNGEPFTATASTLAALLTTLELGGARVATAVNGEFVPADARQALKLQPGDAVEVVSPRQGG